MNEEIIGTAEVIEEAAKATRKLRISKSGLLIGLGGVVLGVGGSIAYKFTAKKIKAAITKKKAEAEAKEEALEEAEETDEETTEETEESEEN